MQVRQVHTTLKPTLSNYESHLQVSTIITPRSYIISYHSYQLTLNFIISFDQALNFLTAKTIKNKNEKTQMKKINTKKNKNLFFFNIQNFLQNFDLFLPTTHTSFLVVVVRSSIRLLALHAHTFFLPQGSRRASQPQDSYHRDL